MGGESDKKSIRYFPVLLDGRLFQLYPSRSEYRLGDVVSTYLHYHDTLELGICLSGRGTFYIGNRSCAFYEGDVSIIQPRVPHIAQSYSGETALWRFVDVDPRLFSADELKSIEGLSGVFSSDGDETLYGKLYFPRLLDELEAGDGAYSVEIASALIRLCVFAAYRSRPPHELLQGAAVFDNKQLSDISKAIVYISTHYTEAIRLDDLAKMCSLSVSTFRRMFFSTFGKTPFDYIYGLRIDMAKILLSRTSKSIQTTAFESGYQTISSFNRHFKRYEGISPTSYRKLKRRGT